MFTYQSSHFTYTDDFITLIFLKFIYLLTVLGFELRAGTLLLEAHLQPFYSIYFGDWVSFSGQASLDHHLSSYFKLPTIAGITGKNHHAQLFSLEIGS
jgi:hypothetical protein